jgi:sugar phosphate isomerase/epimerase
MRFGVCGGPDLGPVAKAAGYEFLEWTVGALLCPREPREKFEAALAAAKASPVPIEALNCFVPADLKITGPAVDTAALDRYTTTAFERAKEAGVKTIVFGSGGARKIPEGFDRAAAWRQIVAFTRTLGPKAKAAGVTVAVEPLHKGECNVMNGVDECAGLVREVGHPNVRLLVDSFHLYMDQEPLEHVVADGKLLAHVHLSTTPGRVPPGSEPYDFAPFFRALRQGGYDGRVSIEAAIKNPAEELPRALGILRAVAKG